MNKRTIVVIIVLLLIAVFVIGLLVPSFQPIPLPNPVATSLGL